MRRVNGAGSIPSSSMQNVGMPLNRIVVAYSTIGRTTSAGSTPVRR
jgi:hypothetical protein